MNCEFKLRILKLLVNLPFSLIDRILKFPPARYPQTQMLQAMYKDALEVYAQHVSEGVFGSSPDGNFPQFLSVSVKVLSLIAEEDRYYRAWLGFAFIMAQRECESYHPSPLELKRLIKSQWGDNIDFLSDSVLKKYMDDFKAMALTNSFSNLLKKT